MTFLNAFLVDFGEKEQRGNENKELKTLNTLLHRKQEDAL